MEATQSQPDGTVHEKFLGNHGESAAASQQQSEVQAGMPSTQTGQAQNESVSNRGVSFSSCPQGLTTGGNVDNNLWFACILRSWQFAYLLNILFIMYTIHCKGIALTKLGSPELQIQYQRLSIQGDQLHCLAAIGLQFQ